MRASCGRCGAWLRSPDFRETFHGLPVEVPAITGPAGGRVAARLPLAHSVAFAAGELEHPGQPRHRSHPHGRRDRTSDRWRHSASPSGLPGVPDGLRRRRDRCDRAVGRGLAHSLPVERPGRVGHGDTRRATARCSACGEAARHWRPAACGGCTWAPMRWRSSGSIPTSLCSSSWPATSPSPCASRCPTSAVGRSITCSASAAAVVAQQVVIDVPSAGAGVWRVEGV